MNVAASNLEDILAWYFYETAASAAADHLDRLRCGGQVEALRTLLRDYREEPVWEPREISMRTAVDRLLTACSVLEVASLAAFVPRVEVSELGARLKELLDEPSLRRYYEEFYPMRLPQLFRRRLMGYPFMVKPLDQDHGRQVFMGFLALDRGFASNLEDGVLLRMLDSFSIQGVRFVDVVGLIGRPADFVEQLLRKKEERETLGAAVSELSAFMEFCFDLQRLLKGAGALPVLQSAMWNYYGYWFEILGQELDEKLGEVLKAFLGWRPTGEVAGASKAVQAYVAQASDVLRDLTSERYGGPVRRLLA